MEDRKISLCAKERLNIEKLELHSVDKLTKAILLYSIISVKVMNITYLARIHPDKLCSDILDEDEWKTLYTMANKTNTTPEKPYTVLDAIMYLGTIGGYKRSPSDGLPGLEAVWNGLIKLQIIMEYKSYLI